MDLVSKSYTFNNESQSLPPIQSQETSIFQSHFHSSDTNFPIIAIAIIGILATALLLVTYYIFVIKCCLNWHRLDLLRPANPEDSSMAPVIETQGLDGSSIRSIPIFHYRKSEKGEKCYCECAVCLNEFQENEKLRIIPNCSHLFHIDCIDVWLQTNANCPLCRITISSSKTNRFDQIINSCQDPDLFSRNVIVNGNEDYVVIELGNQTSNSGELEQTNNVRKKVKKFEKVRSMGDECIEMGRKDERFSVNPMRRSFSMDSSGGFGVY